MDSKKIIISGVGCALADFLYTNIDFSGSACQKYLSKREGDGGMSPGKLIFTEELEKFSNKPFPEILSEIVGNQSPDVFNLGGPSLVSLINASQLLDREEYEVKFFGIAGEDETSERIFEALKQLPLDIRNYSKNKKYSTPFTNVLSDPAYNNGNGERTFINNIGAAWFFDKSMLGEEFFNSDIVCFGGTALMPQIHDNLTALLQKAKANNCITVVNTVYDFRNEKGNPGYPWPLGDSSQSLGLIDVLIMNAEESIKISGQKTLDEAVGFFMASGISSFIITNGTSHVIGYSSGSLFPKTGIAIRLPISKKVSSELLSIPANQRDTTGCGDNFAGGIICSLAWQLKDKTPGKFDLIEALSWGIASGGFACYTVGGTYFEKYPGEKLELVGKLQQDYLSQIGV